MRRVALLVLLLLVAAVLIPASPGWAQRGQPTATSGAVEVRADFNHDGADDLAVAAPYEDVGNLVDPGAVSVLYGSAAGLTTVGGRLFTQVGGAAEPFDLFGTAVAAGDFNGNGVADLAVGANGEGVGRIVGAGAVSVLYGSAGGAHHGRGSAAHQRQPRHGGSASERDQFGKALTTGDTG